MDHRIESVIAGLDGDRPVLIAGPTASGKSAVAVAAAERLGGAVVNADALQVYSDWRILTARPSPEDEAKLPHILYGHIDGDHSYSVGQWLREVAHLLKSDRPPVIVGGTGLYFSALTEGLAAIPEVPPSVRDEADRRMREDGAVELLAELDRDTAARIDRANPVRIQRAWEVLRATGTGLAQWQDRTGPAVLPLAQVDAFVLAAPRDWLDPRIASRFDTMLDTGVLDEARDNAPTWRPDLPSAKAIGATELIAHIRGEMELDEVRQRVAILTGQYAKRQRTWLRSRMSDWRWIEP